MTAVPSSKVTTQSIATLLAAIAAAILFKLFNIELDVLGAEALVGLCSLLVGLASAYLAHERRPPPSSYPHLPPEVAPPR